MMQNFIQLLHQDLDGRLVAKPFDIRQIIGKTFDEAEGILEKRGLSLRIIIEDRQPQMLTMDMPNRVNVEVRGGKIVRIVKRG